MHYDNDFTGTEGVKVGERVFICTTNGWHDAKVTAVTPKYFKAEPIDKTRLGAYERMYRKDGGRERGGDVWRSTFVIRANKEAISSYEMSEQRRKMDLTRIYIRDNAHRFSDELVLKIADLIKNEQKQEKAQAV